jgi:predicted naringenin-chalcone synthase
MTFQITGLGTAAPEEFITQEGMVEFTLAHLGAMIERPAQVQALFRRAGVRTRHSVLLNSSTNGEPARQSFYSVAVDAEDRGPTTAARMRRFESDVVQLAARAAQTALDDARTGPETISHLVTVSCSGLSSPGVDVDLIEHLRLPAHVTRTNIGFMGCHGALNALRVANGLAAADPGARVLICCVELCTLHQQYSGDLEQLVAGALFSDGAAAVVGRSIERNTGDAKGNARHAGWNVVAQRSALLPGTGHMMSWRIGDHGFHMTLSPEVPDVIRRELRPWMTAWLAQHKLKIDEVRGWAIHPGGPRILSACAESLGLENSRLDASHQVLAEFGNMSSPTTLFILDRLRRQEDTSPCVALAFGPGLTIEAALLTVEQAASLPSVAAGAGRAASKEQG